MNVAELNSDICFTGVYRALNNMTVPICFTDHITALFFNTSNLSLCSAVNHFLLIYWLSALSWLCIDVPMNLNVNCHILASYFIRFFR